MRQNYLDQIFKDHKNPKSRSLRLFGFRFWSFYYHNKFGWCRLFGKGLKWKDISIHGLTFSERGGYSKGLRIGKWLISYLPASKPIINYKNK